MAVADRAVEISEATWKMLEAYNALKTLNLTVDDPDFSPLIDDALTSMHSVLREMLSKDLLEG